MIVIDGNQAVANIAYKNSDMIAMYPITPSSPMAEHSEFWAAKETPNLLDDIPNIVEMQSEAGAIATVHGAAMAGSQATTFTSSQGLLLMIPTLYKLAGELTPFVLHVAARTVASHALSIFCDHSDIMAVRQTGCAILSADSVQQAQDFAFISHLATFKSRLPFIHFFDGFQTSHELQTIELLPDSTMSEMLDNEAMNAFRERALTPSAPTIRGTSANADTFFQSREAANIYYDNCADIVEEVMNEFAEKTNRFYQPFSYFGAENPDSVIIAMGSSLTTIKETVEYLTAQGESVGVLSVHLYRPFSAKHFLSILPKSVKKIAVLDRTKEAGAHAEPLYLDVLSVISDAYQKGEFEQLPSSSMADMVYLQKLSLQVVSPLFLMN
ncbi:hypothetical protein L0B53_13200 [Vibrio sp. SS-MA-C1-2]|uniref:hypothetical protein n=1 Tax=Vibrio sp. SS-MA-C1-2 TaxID=2908646 RepID=UPI001F300BF6|nr:hypothetical protein [Vibrio sp. SS-MA-C1-2]UJF17978.1 hypothetical protein L0B53_13200 [Vibrio sp. SS-MA-C1-2]